jgi:hypothetical protein
MEADTNLVREKGTFFMWGLWRGEKKKKKKEAPEATEAPEAPKPGGATRGLVPPTRL